MQLTIDERWEAKINRQGSNGCWEWTAAISDTGYGKFSIRTNVTVNCHRYSYELAHGPIPAGLHVCHHCDNRKCVNPRHLFLGTNLDNIIDSMKKGRRKGVPRPKWGPDHTLRLNRNLVLRGERHGQAKLTDEEVAEIRRADVSFRGARSALARKYGVSDCHITRLLRNESRNG